MDPELRLGLPAPRERTRTQDAHRRPDNKNFLQAGKPGPSPWLGGIDADDFGGVIIEAASFLGFDAVSPVHGTPQNGIVTDPAYVPYVTTDMVNSAHEKGMPVIPWTVDDKPMLRALKDIGVDRLITDYPDRLRNLMAERSLRLPKQYSPNAVAP